VIPTKVDVTNVVQELEKRFLPDLQKVAEEIAEQFPRVKATVWSSPVGSLTDYQGHDLGIDCLLTDTRPEQTDNVALIIGIGHLTTTPLIDQAGICWGAPSAHVEAELFLDPIEVTAETLQELEARLPLLYDALQTAVRRGHPPDET
jgi:hypothetical protein